MPKPSREALQELMDIPEQIRTIDRNLNGMKNSKKEAERKLTALEARVMKGILDGKEYTSESARKTAHTVACHDSEEWQKLTARIDQLAGTIRAAEGDREYLRRRRQGLRVMAEQNYLDRAEALLQNADFKAVISAGLLA